MDHDKLPPILYAEDEEFDVLLLEAAFEQVRLVHPLKVVRDGQQAIDYLAGRGRFADREEFPVPRLLLLDINLPLKSGFEVLEWLKSRSELRHLPVIVYSSSAQEGDAERARRLGANDFWLKPSSTAERREQALRLKTLLSDPGLA